MTLLQYVGLGLLVVLALYIAARVISAAYFRSLADHDMRKQQNGTSQHNVGSGQQSWKREQPWP